MAKHSTNKSRCQGLVAVSAATVGIPLPLLATLEDVENAFFGLCIETGKQVLLTRTECDPGPLAVSFYLVRQAGS